MINKSLRLTAGFLASVLVISSVPVEALGAESVEPTAYITGGTYSFAAGALSAINETVVLNTEDDSVLVDNETGVTENEAPTVSEPEVQEPVVEETIPEEIVPEETPAEPVNPYANIAIANNINSYLNVRQ